MRTARASASIDAPITAVWRVLTDFAGYGGWNPFIVRVEGPSGPLGPGSELRFRVRWITGGGASSRHRVTVFQPPEAAPEGEVHAVLSYAYDDAIARFGLLRSTRSHVLRQPPGGATRYETWEDFSGMLSPLIPLAKVQAGFDAQTAAMKSRLDRP